MSYSISQSATLSCLKQFSKVLQQKNGPKMIMLSKKLAFFVQVKIVLLRPFLSSNFCWTFKVNPGSNVTKFS